jgi:cobalt-zinc-cadmium efflux system protein
MEHSHSNSRGNNLSNAFKISIGINIVFIIFETLYGFLSNSMALIADAGHNFSDMLALGFSWIALTLSERKPTMKFTYGFRRSTILVAMLNTIILLIAIAFIAWKTFKRIGEPVAINSGSVILAASIGILVNGFTAWLFMKDQSRDLNIRSAFLHFITDTLVSLGVVLTGIFMSITKIVWVDSVMSLTIIVIILYSTYKLLIDSVSLALDAVPENINLKAVLEYLQRLPEVIGVHDLHVWALSTTDTAITVHLMTNTQTNVTFIRYIQKQLNDRFGIVHATIQVEYGNESFSYENNCN